MYLEVAGFEKDFEVRFESLQKKFRSGEAGADTKDGVCISCFLANVFVRADLYCCVAYLVDKIWRRGAVSSTLEVE
jgi:hypothetical protein